MIIYIKEITNYGDVVLTSDLLNYDKVIKREIIKEMISRNNLASFIEDAYLSSIPVSKVDLTKLLERKELYI